MPGFVTNQKVRVVANDETSMNTAIEAENTDGWIAIQITILDTENVIILFSKTAQAV